MRAATPTTARRALRLLAAVAAGALGPSLHAAPPVEAETLDGLDAPASVLVDELGVPRIVAEGRLDALRAQGFMHARERFFQMDLLRRRAAGRLAELFGAPLLPQDRAARALRFAATAERVLAGVPERHRAQLRAYTEGVNAGLAATPMPAEYLVLGLRPEPWRDVDCVLVLDVMLEDLRTGAETESMLDVMHEALPEGVVAFLTPPSSRFDAPVSGPAGLAHEPAPIPPSSVFDLRPAPEGAAGLDERGTPGSNGWIVSGARTTHGGAILANDMHLTLGVPGVWYRVQLEWADAERDRRLVGISLPGAPGLIVGSSGDLAWGFTNLTGDLEDFVRVEVDPDDASRYRVPGGFEAFGEIVETIEVRGGEPVELRLATTRWGAVRATAADGAPLVLRWQGLDPAAVDFDVLDLPDARTLEEGLDIVQRWWGPPQNVMLASRDGRIGWSVAGWIPQRRGFDGRLPVSWAAGDAAWAGNVPPGARPRVVEPAGGFLATANNRTVDLAASAALGHAFALGTRAARIAERLAEIRAIDERSMHELQLDTRAPLLDPYRDVLLSAEDRGDLDPLVARARAIVDGWNGTADADQAGYRLLRRFRAALLDEVIGPLVAPCRAIDPSFSYSWPNRDDVLLRLLEARPAHLLPPGHETWDDVAPAVFARVVAALGPGAEGGVETPWGEVNRAAIRHPASVLIPAWMRDRIGQLDMPADPLDGDLHVVRVARPTFGASVRLVVSPGREEAGICVIPAGQSGRPGSPNYADHHPAWVAGETVPLLAGEPVREIRLEP